MGWIVTGIYGALLAVAFWFGGTQLALALLLAVLALSAGFRLDLAGRWFTGWGHLRSRRPRVHSSS